MFLARMKSFLAIVLGVGCFIFAFGFATNTASRWVSIIFGVLFLLVSLGAFLGESWGYIAYLAGEYSHIMLIILSISAVSGILWLLGNKKRDDF